MCVHCSEWWFQRDARKSARQVSRIVPSICKNSIIISRKCKILAGDDAGSSASISKQNLVAHANVACKSAAGVAWTKCPQTYSVRVQHVCAISPSCSLAPDKAGHNVRRQLPILVLHELQKVLPHWICPTLRRQPCALLIYLHHT